MTEISDKWLTIEEAAKRFGYSHPESLRQRLRQLRKSGQVVDTGKPPRKYQSTIVKSAHKITLYWLNSKIVLIRNDIPRTLFNPKRGKRRVIK